MWRVLIVLLIFSLQHSRSQDYCCQSLAPQRLPSLCSSNSSCIVADLDGSVGSSEFCLVTQDDKFENSLNRSEEAIFDCMIANWNNKDTFDESDQLPFFIEIFPVEKNGINYVGLDLRLHYIEFINARFRIMNLHHCGNPYHDRSSKCDPRCVRLVKSDKKNNQAFLSYSCEAAIVTDSTGLAEAAAGDTYLLSMCMINTGEPQLCGEYWFLVPPATAQLDKHKSDHQVLLLVDKEEYDSKSEVIIYIPTSHVLLHDADMLSIQLLHDSDESEAETAFADEFCWHSKKTARIIHTQNITFNKYPGQNIRVRLTHFLPSGKYQVAMVPYRKDKHNVLIPMAKPSCTCRLERLDLGKHALAIILVLLGIVIFSGIFSTMYSNFKDDDYPVKEPTNIVVIADVDISEEHNEMMDKFFKYLKEYGGVEKVFFVNDPENGLETSENIRTWWQNALRDPKVVKDGCLIVVAGPPLEEASSQESQFPSLLDIQMSELNPAGAFEEREIVQPANIQLNMHTCMNQRRVAVLRFPYSDMRTLPSQLPVKVRINATIAVPLEMKELYRQIQRAEQLTVSINLQKNLHDSSMGRDLLRSINGLCTKEKQFPVKDEIRFIPTKAIKSRSDLN